MVDIKQFETLVNKYRKDLYRYCYSRSGNDTVLADEALADTLKVLYEKWDTLDKGGELRVYMFKVADFCIRSRRSKKHAHYSRTQSLEAALAEGVLNDEVYYDSYFTDDTPVEVYVERILRSLNDDERELFRLRFIEKKPLLEITDLTGIPYSTLRYRIFKLEKRVREEIKKIFK